MSAVAHFKQADVTRAVRGAEAGGMRVARVRIDPRGFIEVEAAQPGAGKRGNSWDDVLP